MTRKLAMAAFGGLLIVFSAQANAPLPKSLKYVDPPVCFEGIDKQADYVFYLKYVSGIPGYPRPAKLVEVKNAANIKVDGIHIFSMTLLAMERKEFEKRAKDEPKLEWLTEKANGVLATTIDQPATTAPVNAKVVPVTTYRVTLKDGKLSAEKVEDKKSSLPRLADLVPTWAFGVVCSFSLSWLGIWFVRRMAPSRRC